MTENKIDIWHYDEVSDMMETIFELYGHEYINEDAEVLRELIFMEYGYWPPLYVLNFLARSASDF